MLPAEVIFRPGPEYAPGTRKWQGCPTIERTPGGRLWAAWYTGGDHEPHMENINVVAISDDNGATWIDPYLVIAIPPQPLVRMLDIELWKDPLGRLWVIWTQTVCGEETLTEGYAYHGEIPAPPGGYPMLPFDFWDDRYGVYAIVTENPDDAAPVWTAPRRLCDGVVRNKPIVLADGRWVLCAYDSLYPTYTYYVSGDQGETWQYQQGAYKYFNRQTDETMMVQCGDGSLWMMLRTRKGIGQSFSFDGGEHWTPFGYSLLENPYSRFYIGRLASGRLLLVKHHQTPARANLAAYLSDDDGMTWPHVLILDERTSVTYPEAIQEANGQIIVTYDWERGKEAAILLARFREEDVVAGAFVTPGSVKREVISQLRG